MDDVIVARMQAVLDALLSGDNALSPLPKRVVNVAPGLSVPDDACCQGQLSTRLAALSPQMGRTPASGAGNGPCAVLWWNATIEVKIARCAHVINDNGVAPTPENMQADGQQVLSDVSRIIAVIQGLSSVVSIGAWQPTGPDGGCTGGTITFVTRV